MANAVIQNHDETRINITPCLCFDDQAEQAAGF